MTAVQPVAPPHVAPETRRRRKRRRHPIPSWPRRQPIPRIRQLLLRFFVFAVLRLGYSVSVVGRRHAMDVPGSCLIVANHNLHLDQSAVLYSLPSEFRKRVAIAASANDIYGNRFRGFFASLLGNAFPFNTKGSGVRESLEIVGQMLDDGYHVLIFPEGKLTLFGPMQPFKSGTGFLATEIGVPVLPVRIDVVRKGPYEGRWLPIPRGKLRVHIGEPLVLERRDGYAEATRRVEAAVRDA